MPGSQKSSTRGLRQNTLIYGAAVGIERVFSLLIIPILTKTLPQELYGIWTQIIITSSFIVPLLLLRMDTGLINFFAGLDKSEKSRALHSILWIFTINCLVLLAISVLCGQGLSNLMFGSSSFEGYVLLFSTFLIGDALVELLFAYLRAEERIDALSAYYLVKYLGRVLILLLCLGYLHVSFQVTLTAVVFWQLLFGIVLYVGHINKNLRPKMLLAGGELRHRWAQLLTFSLPLIPVGVFIWLNIFASRYFIIHMLGLPAVSVYAAAYSISGSVIGLVYAILGFTLYPKLASHWNRSAFQEVSNLLPRVISFYLFLAIPAVAAFTILSEPLTRVLATRNYVCHWSLTFTLAASIALFGLYQLYFYVVLLGKKTLSGLLCAATASIVNIGINFFLIPAAGLLGAALAACFSNGIMAAWTYIEAYRTLPFGFFGKDLLKILAATLAMCIGMLAFSQWVTLRDVWQLVSLILIGGILYLSVILATRYLAIPQFAEFLNAKRLWKDSSSS